MINQLSHKSSTPGFVNTTVTSRTITSTMPTPQPINNTPMFTPETVSYIRQQRRRVSSTPRLNEVEKQRRVLKRRTWCDKENTPMVLDLENNLQWEHASAAVRAQAFNKNAAKLKDFSMIKQCKSVKKIIKDKVNSIKRSSSLYRKRCFSESIGQNNNKSTEMIYDTVQSTTTTGGCKRNSIHISSDQDTVEVTPSVKKIKLQPNQSHSKADSYECYTPLRPIDRCTMTPSNRQHVNPPPSLYSDVPVGFSEPVMYRTRVRTNGSLNRAARPLTNQRFRPVKLYPQDYSSFSTYDYVEVQRFQQPTCNSNTIVSPIQEIPDSYKCLPLIPFLDSPSLPVSSPLPAAAAPGSQSSATPSHHQIQTPKRNVRFQFDAESTFLDDKSLDHLISQAREELMRERCTPVSGTRPKPSSRLTCTPSLQTPSPFSFTCTTQPTSNEENKSCLSQERRGDEYLDMHFTSSKPSESVYIDMNTLCT